MNSAFPWRLAAAGAVLFALNAAICGDLFWTEYTRQVGSIEGAYISIARYALENPFEWGWFPLWYGGIPYQNAYPPLLHLVVASAAGVADVSPALAYHFVTALTYSLGPVALFAMAFRLSGRFWASLAGATLYSVLSPANFLIAEIREDVGGAFFPRRFQALTVYGEGPKQTALLLLPLAVLLLDRLRSELTATRAYLTAFALAAVVLTNWLGGASLAMAVLAYLLAHAGPGWRGLTVRAFGTGALAYALAAPWIPPSTMLHVRRNAQEVAGHYPMTAEHLKYVGLLLIAVVLLHHWLERSRRSPYFRFNVYFLLFTAALALGDAWLGVALLPQPQRYHLEMEMALCLLLGLGLASAAGRLPRASRAWVAGGFLLFVVFQAQTVRHRAAEFAAPLDMEARVESRTARWLAENLAGERVFAVGSVAYWLNFFGDSPQLQGGFDQGIANPWIPMVRYGVKSTEPSLETTGAWLKAFGVQAVCVNGPQSKAAYHDYRHPEAFGGVFPELWRDGDDVIYRVPQRSASLARAIRPEDQLEASPTYFFDVEGLNRLVAAYEDPALPEAELEWLDPSRARIRAELEEFHLIAVQVTYHPGWRAFVEGEPRPLRRDALGMMLIEPRCAGACEVDLVYDGGAEMLLARAASGLALVGWPLWWWRDRRTRRGAEVRSGG